MSSALSECSSLEIPRHAQLQVAAAVYELPSSVELIAHAKKFLRTENFIEQLCEAIDERISYYLT